MEKTVGVHVRQTLCHLVNDFLDFLFGNSLSRLLSLLVEFEEISMAVFEH